MLVVDPMKRITIPEIRRHPWFTHKLPAYLSRPPFKIEKEVRSCPDLLVVLSLSMLLVAADVFSSPHEAVGTASHR